MDSVVAEILEENSWRDGEFARLKIVAPTVDEAIWCRMALLMVYAHWEGFIVSATKILFRNLSAHGVRSKDATTEILVTCLKDSYRRLSGKQSFEQRVEFTREFLLLIDSDIKMQGKLDTRSNLNSKVLSEICAILKFDFNRYSELTSDIDRLVNIRNNIAHGENAFVLDRVNIQNYIRVVTEAIDVFVEQVEGLVSSKTYLLQPDFANA